MSSKPSKVRKRLFEAPAHFRSKQFSSHLSDELHSKHRTRSLRARKGDTVKIMRGEYKGIEGKVAGLDMMTGRITIEGVTRGKVAGGTVPIKIHPSKVVIMSLNLDDKLRKNKLEARQKEA